MVKIVICDDDKMALDTYSDFCRRICVKHGIDADIRTYGSGSDLLFDLEDPKFYNSLDLLFLDIYMPGSNGVEVAREARKLGYSGIIVFITVSEDNYRDAFDVGAFNYIVKGESYGRFEEVFLKAVDLFKNTSKKEIVLVGWGEIKTLAVRSIEYFEIVHKVVTVYYDNQSFEFQGSLSELENRLEDSGFQRIHRNYLVSLAYIKNVAYEEITLLSGKSLPVGRKYYGALKREIQKISLSHKAEQI